MLALLLGSNLGAVIGLLGTGSIIAAILLLVIAMVAGYFLGGPDPAVRRTLALATGQRNLAAALVVATGNFADRPNVLIFLAAAGLIAMVLVMPIAGWLGRRVESPAELQGASSFTVVAASGGNGAKREGEHTGD
jgi:BASS family bile acid:Na+ symporter